MKRLNTVGRHVLLDSLRDMAGRIKSADLLYDEDFEYGIDEYFAYAYWDDEARAQRVIVPYEHITAREVAEFQKFALQYECIFVAKLCTELHQTRANLFAARVAERRRLQRRAKLVFWLMVIFFIALPTLIAKVFE